MYKNRKLLYFFSIFILSPWYSIAQTNIIQRCNLKLIDIIQEDVFSPLVASRNMVYPNIAAYEVLKQDHPNYQSLSGQISHLPLIPAKSSNVQAHIAAVAAFLMTAKHYIYTEEALDAQLYQDSISFLSLGHSPALIHASILYGHAVAKHIINWSKGDNYAYTRTLTRYTLTDTPGAWRQTPPEYHNGLEPNWMLIRKMCHDTSFFYSIPNPIAYSQDTNSAYYRIAYEVYRQSQELTEEQKSIALYWDDNPATTMSAGHAMYVVKKPTPGNHWMKIASQLMTKNQYTDMQSAEVFALLSIGIFDGFIHCWHTKYVTNTLRPETYIHLVITPNWDPLIETPPFPEFTSGHSVISAVSADILSSFFGEKTAFVDSGQMSLGMGARRFSSLRQAAEEASYSRWYGGIHYRPALLLGAVQGRKIAADILNRFRTH